MAATSSDYGWIEDWNNGLFFEAYCLTFVRALGPGEVLARLNARDPMTLQGASAAAERAYDAWSAGEGRELFVAVAQADGWSVMFEANGYVGVTGSLMVAVSAGTSTVAHFRNVNAVDRFLWLEDGQTVLEFEPLFPTHRTGARADDVTSEMTAAGFDLSDADEGSFEDHTAAAFALAERITGVTITARFLDEARFLGALVPIPV